VPLESWASNRRFGALTRMLRRERRRRTPHDRQRGAADGGSPGRDAE